MLLLHERTIRRPRKERLNRQKVVKSPQDQGGELCLVERIRGSLQETYCVNISSVIDSESTMAEKTDDKISLLEGVDDFGYLYGFQRSNIFLQLFHRMAILEKWRELAIRPTIDECDQNDMDLFDKEMDDPFELQERCHQVRSLMNRNLPPIEKVKEWDLYLKPRPSRIKAAGIGLFYEGNIAIPNETTICYYTGHLHSFQSSRRLEDKTYLMMVLGETFVDPRPCLDIKARYINDPLNENALNCKYEPMKYRAAVVTTRSVKPGEELFAAYGEFYWSQHPFPGKVFKY